MLNGSFHCDKKTTPQSFSMFFIKPDSIYKLRLGIRIKKKLKSL